VRYEDLRTAFLAEGHTAAAKQPEWSRFSDFGLQGLFKEQNEPKNVLLEVHEAPRPRWGGDAFDKSRDALLVNVFRTLAARAPTPQ
jgi:hypothetical protein